MSLKRGKNQGQAPINDVGAFIIPWIKSIKLFNYYKTKKLSDYLIAPDGLEAQQFKKPSAKRLSKKGRRINMRAYKIEQA